MDVGIIICRVFRKRDHSQDIEIKRKRLQFVLDGSSTNKTDQMKITIPGYPAVGSGIHAAEDAVSAAVRHQSGNANVSRTTGQPPPAFGDGFACAGLSHRTAENWPSAPYALR